MEEMAAVESSSGRRVLAVRPFNVVGPGQTGACGHGHPALSVPRHGRGAASRVRRRELETLVQSRSHVRCGAARAGRERKVLAARAAGDQHGSTAIHVDTLAGGSRHRFISQASPRVRRWFVRHPRFQVHFTPTSASWLNLVERWFALMSEKQIKRGAHRSVRAVEATIREYLAITNERPTPFVWTKTADQILAQVAKFCQRTSNPGHQFPVSGFQFMSDWQLGTGNWELSM
jgi:hypothetical protein